MAFSADCKRGRKKGAARKLSKSVEKLFDTFWRFLTVFCPARKLLKSVEKRFDTFWRFLTFFDVAPFRRPLLQSADIFRKTLVSVKFLSAILGPEMAAPILWAPGKNAFFLQEKTMSIKFLLLGGGGGILGFLGGGVPILFFYGCEDFSDLNQDISKWHFSAHVSVQTALSRSSQHFPCPDGASSLEMP